MVTRREGHSLPEVLVAMTFLAVSAVAVGATALLGARWTADAVVMQDAVRLATSVLDSVTVAYGAGAGTGSGSLKVRELEARWWPEPAFDPVLIRVEVVTGDGVELVTLHGLPRPRVPVLPDGSGAAGGGP